MLKGITWGQFSSFMLVVTGVYYFYVGLRYYKDELLGWLKGRGRVSNASAMEGRKDKEATNGPAPKATAGQAQLLEGAGPRDGDSEAFQSMQRAIGVIGQVITQGVENKLDRENLLDHIREVLADYRKLRKTEYAETINNFVTRACGDLSLHLSEKEMADLWK